MKKVLIIGFGAIAKRHYDLFKGLKSELAIVTKRDIEDKLIFRDIGVALNEFSPEVIIITNDTALHEQTLRELASFDYKGIVVVEKPLGIKAFELKHAFSSLVVAYNLRMSPILEKLKIELTGKEIITANIYCGQYLPDWRPNRDYRTIYSARKAQGGGVLRDLSHELDYVSWLFGKIDRVVSRGGHFSNLDIDTDDIFTFIGESDRCKCINVSVNYLDRVARRFILINTQEETYYGDLISGKLIKNNEVLIDNAKVSDTYADQARCILRGELDSFCSFEEGLLVMKLIERIEESNMLQRFVEV